MQKKDKNKENKDLKKHISQLEMQVAKHQRFEDVLRQALRREYDDREKRITEQTADLIAANTQLRQEVLERKKAEEALHYRAELEKLIATLSTDFIKLLPEETDEAINKALETIGRFVDVDRTYVVLFSDDGKSISDVYEWCAEEVKPQIQGIKGGLIEDEFPWFDKKIKKESLLHLDFSQDLLIEIKEYLKAHKIQSLINVPMFCGRSFIGFVGFASIRNKKSWEIDIIALLRIVGEIFANAIEHKKMGLALRKSENKYRLLFKIASDGIVVLDTDGVVLDCNDAFIELTGINRKEIIGNMLENCMVEKYKKLFIQKIPEIKEYGNSELELEIITKNGKQIPIWCKITAICDEIGKFKGMFTHCRDITEKRRDVEMLRKAHKEMQKKVVENNDNLLLTRTLLDKEKAELRAAEETIRLAYAEIDQIFNTAADGMGIIDINFNMLQANNTLLKIIDIPRDELKGKKCYELFTSSLCHTSDCPMIKLPEDKLARMEKKITVKVKDVSKVPCVLTAMPFYGHGGEFIGIIENFKDISDFPKIHGVLKKEILRNRKMFDIFAEGFFMTDMQGNFIYTNHAFSDLVGYSVEELACMRLKDLQSEEDSETTAGIKKGTMQKGSTIFETSYLHKNGKIINACGSTSIFKIGVNKYLISSVRKRTDNQEMEERFEIFSSFLKHSEEGIAIMDMNDDLLYVNKAFVTMHGLKEKEIIGRNLYDCLSPQQKKYIDMNEFQNNGKEEFSAGVWYPGTDGKPFLSEILRSYILDTHGNPAAKLIIIKNITDKKASIEIEKDRLETEKAFLNAFNDSAFLLDTTGVLVALNERAEKYLGKKTEDILGWDFCNLFSPDRSEKIKAKIEETIHSAKTVEYENRSGDDELHMSFYPIGDEQGNVIKIAVLLHGIKESVYENGKTGILLPRQKTGRYSASEPYQFPVKREEKKGHRDFAGIKYDLEGKDDGQSFRFEGIIGRNKKLWELFDILPSVAESVSTVLIHGESGTGKHLIAQAIHNLSPRKDKAFIIVNCGALPDTLLESELFGYKAGAFTDAKKDKMGRFAIAEGGSLFLDEIGDISPAMQVRLLRFLQERVYEPLGSVKTIKANVRIITATNKNLMDLVKEGRFREDLYYRINVVRLDLPPLRERLEDVPLLVNHFIEQLNRQRGKKITGITEEAMICLLSYDYPGNIRELENIIERSFVLCQSEKIGKEDLPESLFASLSIDYSKNRDLTTFMKMEAAFLMNILRQNDWSRIKTARQLGIHKATLFRKINSLGLKLPSSKKRTQ
ncbi:MAG: sigma 54-interacting transcriptional regulator [bacterium]